MPFSAEQFYEVFRQYNHAVYPAQFALFILACVAVYFAALPSRTYDRIACGILAFFLLWTGLAYHAAFFAEINPAAAIFAAAFIVEALLVWWIGVRNGRIELRLRNDPAGWVGSAAIVYALVVYPIWGSLLGHAFPELPTFGTPCPTTIFTFGLLLWAARPFPHYLFIIPGLWALVGTTAATSLGMMPDYGLAFFGIAALGIALGHRRIEHARPA